jgi:DNA invertase Pin-like site-specific DNA recombinase
VSCPRQWRQTIDARKSTDQSGGSDEQRSVARQVEHARTYAARKGWRVLDEHVYVDDGISGAEFADRPGFLRLLNTLKMSYVVLHLSCRSCERGFVVPPRMQNQYDRYPDIHDRNPDASVGRPVRENIRENTTALSSFSEFQIADYGKERFKMLMRDLKTKKPTD